MGYDLISKNNKSKIREYTIGAFSWPMFLSETGMGYILGYGDGMKPASYVYSTLKKAGSPVSNDGYMVTASQSKAMAMVARGFISVNRFINKQWGELTEEERIRMDGLKIPGSDKELYKKGWHEDRLVQLENFAEFAEQSQGFSIH